ncbi:hypothetical protein [Gracilimonas amylolytica]|uniref:hypothetical protein n=1 Tax=Gracilimonas amylolytica TaxID=1749045 RepID=UPI001E456098|nr:hypothetical protein [Gracilimonas amylolytica]
MIRMTSFAIYEFVAFILALPLSYALAWAARKYTFSTYKDEVDRLFAAVWNGEEEDELNAWLKVYRIYLDKRSPKKKRYYSVTLILSISRRYTVRFW